MKLTVKLSKPNRRINELLKQGHELAGPIPDWDGIPGSELYYGQSYDSEPKWKSFLEEGAGQALPEMSNRGAAAILFIPTSGNRYLIYVFGYGFLSVNDGFTEWDFGLKVVLNSISATGIKSMDSHTIAVKSKNKRIQVATQAGIGEFDVDILQDLVSQISGQSLDLDFAKHVTGGESLTLNVDMTGSSIARKSSQIMRKYALTTYKKEFNWIDFVAPIKDPTLIDVLNREVELRVDQIIKGVLPQEFVLSYPTVIDYENTDYILFSGFQSNTEFDVVSMEDFVAEYQHSGFSQLDHKLDNLYIDHYNGHGKNFKSFSIYKCLTGELEFNHSFYILTNGTWFQLDEDHYEAVTNFFNNLLLNPLEFRSGEQTLEANEVGYLAQPLLPGHEILDRHLYRGRGAKNTVEFADILNTNQEIIHVKDGGSSSKLSHLFNQGSVSGRLLLSDKTFRTEFRKKVTDGNIRKLYPLAGITPGSTTIVFRILKKGPTFAIPFFSKIILYDTYLKIKAMGYLFRLEWVEYI